MVDKKLLMSGLDKVGRLIDAARTRKTRLSSMQVREIKSTLGSAAAELFQLKAANVKAGQQVTAKRAALNKSASENLITRADADKGVRQAAIRGFSIRRDATKIQAAIDHVKKLATEVSRLASSPELEKLEKGYPSTDAIKAPEKAASLRAREAARRSFALRRRAAEGEAPVMDSGTVPGNRPPQKGMAPGMPPQFPQAGNTEEKEKGAPINSHAPGMNEGGPDVSANRRARAKKLYTAAMSLTKKAALEKDATKKAANVRQATILERMADKLMPTKSVAAASTPVKTVSAMRKPIGKNYRTATIASTTVYAAAERVLLADGSIGVISSVDGARLKVSVAGIEKTVMANSVKRIISVKKSAEKDVTVKADEKNVTIKIPTEKVEEAVEKIEAKEEKTEKPEGDKAEKVEKPEAGEMPDLKGASIEDRVRAAIKMVRSGKKKTAAEGDAPGPDAKADKAPDAIPAPEAPASDNGTVGKSFTTTYAPAPNGKFNVQISETEIVECATEPEAQALVARSNKQVKATAKTPDSPTDSATTKRPDASVDVSKTLRGLDQNGKGYGSTSKDEKVDPQFSMVKKSTAKTPDSPTDSATTKRPDASADVSKTLRGLDQNGKGYSTTSKEEKVDPQFSMVKKAELKATILVESNRKMAERLSVTEATLLTDRAVKVGAITEEQRGEQQTVLAELYRNAQAEFKAFGRLIANLEANKAQTPTLANRTANKVQASLSRRQSEIIDGGTPGVVSASLENGTFFEDCN